MTRIRPRDVGVAAAFIPLLAAHPYALPEETSLSDVSESLWLFQVRPFVENKRARSSAYLTAMDEGFPAERLVPLDEPLPIMPRSN